MSGIEHQSIELLANELARLQASDQELKAQNATLKQDVQRLEEQLQGSANYQREPGESSQKEARGLLLKVLEEHKQKFGQAFGSCETSAPSLAKTLTEHFFFATAVKVSNITFMNQSLADGLNCKYYEQVKVHFSERGKEGLKEELHGYTNFTSIESEDLELQKEPEVGVFRVSRGGLEDMTRQQAVAHWVVKVGLRNLQTYLLVDPTYGQFKQRWDSESKDVRLFIHGAEGAELEKKIIEALA